MDFFLKRKKKKNPIGHDLSSIHRLIEFLVLHSKIEADLNARLQLIEGKKRKKKEISLLSSENSII